METRAYRVAYDGRAFYGFQRQPEHPTVEQAIFDGLSEAGLDGSDPPAGYAAAGRTDAGVSAVAQTIAFEAPEWLSPRAFTAHLPDAIQVWASTTVPAGFHATHDANWRAYTYIRHLPDPDRDRIAAIEARLSGEHDFHNLAAESTGTVRDISVSSTQNGDFRHVRVRAGGFPRQLVRRLVSLYDRVHDGTDSLDFIDRALQQEPLPGPDGIQPAPAEPLVLTGVGYDRSFEVDEEATATARETFEAWTRTARTRAAVTKQLDRGLGNSGPGDNP